MNKYQEALEWYALHTSFNQFNVDAIQWADETLQELVDRATPMKPVYRIPDISWNKNEKLAHCPTCDWRLDWEQGCHNNKCRQRIDWSEDE